MSAEPRFKIGGSVRVRDDDGAPQWCFDWCNTDLWIVGVYLTVAGYQYDVVEQWPARFHDRMDGRPSGVTTNMHEQDLRSHVSATADASTNSSTKEK